MDKDYWWHNMLLIYPHLQRFHYPFKGCYGDVVEYVYRKVYPWIGRRVLDMGCGMGWINEAWHIREYTGVDQGCFSEPFQQQARAWMRKNGVIHLSLNEFVSTCEETFDTVVCYESFHNFPEELLDLCESPLLSPGGTIIIVDAKCWWPSDLRLKRNGFDLLMDEEIPAHSFDFHRIASASLDLVERLEDAGHARSEILEVAEYNVQPEIYNALHSGAEVPCVRACIADMDLEPPDLRYSIVVLRKR